jgi:cell envelope-related transcriptional attenuator
MKRAQNNVHFLLVGSDERENETSRSDTMIYMVVRPDDKKIAYLSFPRDTLVAIEGYGEDKLNHSYAFGGLALLTATLKNNFHIPIDHTVKVNFKSFQKVIDTMGGITIDVEADMDVPWENINLKKGKQLLNGYNALAYVRWRSDGRGDLGRIERQQKFMHAVSEKFREMKPWTAAKVLWVVYQEVDTDMSFKDMVLLGTKLIGIGKDDIQHYKLTVQDTYINGISYVLFNEENVKAVVDEMNYGIGVQGEVE